MFINPNQELMDVTHRLGIKIEIIRGEQSQIIRSEFSKKFLQRPVDDRAFEKLRDPSGIANFIEYDYLKNFKNSAALVFLEKRYGSEVYIFDSIKSALYTYDNLSNRNFYITNMEMTFAFVLTEETTIAAVGEAADWLDKNRNHFL